jgi:hypothetical protein
MGFLHHYVRDGKSYPQLCVPPSLNNEILLNCHEATTAGHMGTKRTLDKVRICYFWPKMLKQVVHRVRSCVDCRMKK